MCKIGDIILVYNAKNHGKHIGMHPFLVLESQSGTIRGFSFDYIGLLLSSMTTEKKKAKMRAFDGNFPIAREDKNPDSPNNLDSFVVADQFYLFDETKIKYKRIGSVDIDIFNLVIEYIQELSDTGHKIQYITDNASIKEPD